MDKSMAKPVKIAVAGGCCLPFAARRLLFLLRIRNTDFSTSPLLESLEVSASGPRVSKISIYASANVLADTISSDLISMFANR